MTFTELLIQLADANSKPEEPEELDPIRTLRCPKCGFHTYNLWQAYGRTYFKCSKCSHESKPL